jgi:arginine exporter protein ArgO
VILAWNLLIAVIIIGILFTAWVGWRELKQEKRIDKEKGQKKKKPDYSRSH